MLPQGFRLAPLFGEEFLMAKIIPDLLLNFSATCLLVGRLLGHNPHHAAEKGTGAGLGDGRAARKTGSQKEQRNLGSHFTPLSRFDPYHSGLPCQLLLRRIKNRQVGRRDLIGVSSADIVLCQVETRDWPGVIKESMAQGWSGVFELKNGEKTGPGYTEPSMPASSLRAKSNGTLRENHGND